MAVRIILRPKNFNWVISRDNKNRYKMWEPVPAGNEYNWLKGHNIPYELKRHKFIVDPHTGKRNSKPKSYVSLNFTSKAHAIWFKLTWG